MATAMQNQQLSSEEIQKQWDDFSSEEVDWIDGRVNRLIHALTAKFGLSRDEAARQVEAFLASRRQS